MRSSRSCSSSASQPAHVDDGTICGVTIDRSKTYLSIDRVLFPRKPAWKRWWGIFAIEVTLNTFEPWEVVITLILFALIFTPLVWKLASLTAMFTSWTTETALSWYTAAI